MINWIDWKLVEIDLWWMSVVDAHLKRKHCDKGYHRLIPKSLKVTTYKGKKEEVNFDMSWKYCCICGSEFFNTPEDKQAYIEFEKGQKEKGKEFIKLILKDMKRRQDECYHLFELGKPVCSLCGYKIKGMKL